MRKFVVAASVAFVALLFSSPVMGAPTSDELFKMISDKEAKAKSVEADVTSTAKANGREMKAVGHVVSARVDVEGKPVRKFNMTMKTTITAGGEEQTMETKMVCDGTSLWQEIHHPMLPGGVQAVKAPASAGAKMANGALMSEDSIGEIKKPFNFAAAVTEDTIDGKKVYVMEATPKADQPEMTSGPLPSKVKIYVDEETMAMRRMLALDDKGEEQTRVEITNVKLDQPVEAKLFEYTPPAGVEVKDAPAGPAGK